MGKAKEQAKALGCVNNLKPIGLASELHRNDADDHFPPRGIQSSEGVVAATQFLWVGKAESLGGYPSLDATRRYLNSYLGFCGQPVKWKWRDAPAN